MKVTNIPKELGDVASGVKFFASKDMGVIKYDTLEQCKEAYIHADDYFEAQKNVAITVIRANALMSAKKLIMDELWNMSATKVPLDLQKKWLLFLDDIGELQGNGYPKVQVVQILKFANITENAKLKGISIVPQQAQDIRVLLPEMNRDKIGKKTTDVEAMLMYQLLAKEKNDGKPFKKSDDVKTAYLEYHSEPTKNKKKKKDKEKKKEKQEEVEEVYVREIFAEEVGECPTRGVTSMALGMEVIKHIPIITDDEWKKWFRKVGLCVHPDQGGTEKDAMILNKFRDMMKIMFTKQKQDLLNEKWEEDYSQWKDDKGYESDFIFEDEL